MCSMEGQFTLTVEVLVITPEVAVTVVVGVGILRHLHAEDMAVATLYAEKTAGFATARLLTVTAAVHAGSTKLGPVSAMVIHAW